MFLADNKKEEILWEVSSGFGGIHKNYGFHENLNFKVFKHLSRYVVNVL